MGAVPCRSACHSIRVRHKIAGLDGGSVGRLPADAVAQIGRSVRGWVPGSLKDHPVVADGRCRSHPSDHRRMAQAPYRWDSGATIADNRNAARRGIWAPDGILRRLPLQHAFPLRTLRRPLGTQLIDLAPLLVCERCGKNGPLPEIKGLTRRTTPTFARGQR